MNSPQVRYVLRCMKNLDIQEYLELLDAMESDRSDRQPLDIVVTSKGYAAIRQWDAEFGTGVHE